MDKDPVFFSRDNISSVVAGDASDSAVCAYTVLGPSFYRRQALPLSATGLSSGHRELLTVKMILPAFLETISQETSFKTIMWLTDSKNLVSFLEKGSVKTHIQQEVLEIFKMANQA